MLLLHLREAATAKQGRGRSHDGFAPFNENWSEAEIMNTFEKAIKNTMNNSAEVIVGGLRYEQQGIPVAIERIDLPGYPTSEVPTEGLNSKLL
jgi:hypothetical protein